MMKSKRSSRAFIFPFLLAVLLLSLSVAVQAQEEVRPQISADDRVRLAEAFRIGERFGERVWKGWSKAPFAVLLVTPDYEFLVRHPQPSNDFTDAGYDPLLKSRVYFRKRVYSPNLLATFPAVGGVVTIVVGQPEKTSKTSTAWVVTILHEHFHQMQMSQPNYYAEVEALGLARGDQTGQWMLNFPFPYTDDQVKTQFDVLGQSLARALRSKGTKRFPVELRAYLEARKRFQEMLAADAYSYFSFQLWQEGIARYTEYRIAQLAARGTPGKEFRRLKDFTTFAEEANRTRNRILAELGKPTLDKDRRVAFYAIGAAEAMLLDAANPRWQQRYFTEKFSLEKFFNPAGS